MDFGKLIGEAAGAFGGDEAVSALDPNAGFLEKAAGALLGGVGGGKLAEMLEGNSENTDNNEDQDADSDDQTSDENESE